MAATRTFIHFEVAGDHLGVSLDDVSEISLVSRVTPVPRSPAFIRGLANIRGRVVTLLDADCLFSEGDASPAEARGHAVVLAPPREHLAIFTRSRVDIGRGREAEGGPSQGPGGMPGEEAGDRPPLEGIVVMDQEVIHLIPLAALQEHCETRVLERYRRRT
jgi:purine-binding chemotaxis protein CheW